MITGIHIANGLIASSDGVTGTDPLFLFEQADEINCFYHLNYNVACLVKMMGATQEQVAKLSTKGVRIDGYDLRYLPGKYFSITRAGKRVQYCDTFQYHADELWRHNPDEDHLGLAKRASEIGQEVYSALCDVGLHPTTLTSPIRVFQKEVLADMNLPTVDDVPEEAGDYAYRCVKGNLLEAYKIGHFNQVYDYDIVSAYPHTISKLLDIRKGHWRKSTKYEPGATYGFCKGVVSVDSHISPIIKSKGEEHLRRSNYTPNGTWPDHLTKGQWDYLISSGRGEFQIENGWWWFCDYATRPYERVVADLFAHKDKATGLRRTVIKRIPNGIYGKQLEILDGKMGQLFNPVYGAVIETATEVEVVRFCVDEGLDPIHIAVDGVMAEGQVSDSSLSDRIGGWLLSNTGPCFVMGAGTVALKGKNGKGDFSLDYDWVAEQIAANPGATSLTLTKPAPVTIPMSLRGNWQHLGTMREISRSVELTFEEKRMFQELPENAAALYDQVYESQPLDASHIW